MLGRIRELDGAVTFVTITVALTLVSAIACIPVAAEIEPSSGAMLHASVIYVAVVGWQPLVAYAITRRLFGDKHPFDDGVRPVALRHSMFSVIVAVFVLGVAVVIEAVSHQPGTTTPPEVLSSGFSWPTLVRLVVAFMTIVSILWIQAIIEEVAWRGFLLPRLMQALGPWPGLVVHGVVWGLCYSPLFAVAGASVVRSLGYVVTCGLLGVVLGWIRLSTRSIYASAASNATLTICAGLPLLLVGGGSRFSAAFEPPGWLPLVVVVSMIAWYRPWRRAIAIPLRRIPEPLSLPPSE
jgi:membrane protease YdiL (CAAX protease family)